MPDIECFRSESTQDYCIREYFQVSNRYSIDYAIQFLDISKQSNSLSLSIIQKQYYLGFRQPFPINFNC